MHNLALFFAHVELCTTLDSSPLTGSENNMHELKASNQANHVQQSRMPFY